ncbi:MAG TPA: hypothetical protein PKL06_10040 [Chitinophagales bacterium]|nr:hypothetical protein [Chitinophagales bacterium]
MNYQGVIFIYLLLVFLPFLAAVVLFTVFARKKIKADRAAGILPPKKKKKPTLVSRLWQYYLQKRISARK